MKTVVFIRNSDVRYDTRLRKAIGVAIESGASVIFLGWIRDGSCPPANQQEIAGATINARYFTMPSQFGKGFANIFRLGAFNLWLLYQLIKIKDSYDVLYVCDFDVTIPALLVKRLFKKKLIYDIFDFYSHTHKMPPRLMSLVESSEYLVCKSADKVIVCTEKRAVTLLNATKIQPVVIYNTPKVDIEINNNKKSITLNKKLSIVYVGTLAATGRLLYEICEKIKGIANIDFHVAGNGPLEEYFRETANIYKNVMFYGQITNEEALKLQSSADLIFATYDPRLEINRNSAPNKVYEAMALKKPIIVCRNTDADSVIIESDCGHSIEYDADEFMIVIDKYMNNVDLMRLHGENGFRLYQSNYSWNICRDRLHNLFNSFDMES